MKAYTARPNVICAGGDTAGEIGLAPDVASACHASAPCSTEAEAEAAAQVARDAGEERRRLLGDRGHRPGTSDIINVRVFSFFSFPDRNEMRRGSLRPNPSRAAPTGRLAAISPVEHRGDRVHAPARSDVALGHTSERLETEGSCAPHGRRRRSERDPSPVTTPPLGSPVRLERRAVKRASSPGHRAGSVRAPVENHADAPACRRSMKQPQAVRIRRPNRGGRCVS